jgi:predicted acyl esterase
MPDTLQLTVERDVPVRQRDGTMLYADLYRPAPPRKYPVILLCTPYNKSFGRFAYLQLDPMRAASQGYALVIQDTRGRFNSEGELYYFADESRDGCDTVEWAAQQTWSDGYDIDTAYEYTIDLWATSNLFKAGHRIRVEISSSNFPRFDRNPHTGHPFAQDAALRRAAQTLLHDADHPSHIVLPVVAR